MPHGSRAVIRAVATTIAAVASLTTVAVRAQPGPQPVVRGRAQESAVISAREERMRAPRRDGRVAHQEVLVERIESRRENVRSMHTRSLRRSSASLSMRLVGGIVFGLLLTFVVRTWLRGDLVPEPRHEARHEARD
jgi:hypothetical protein